jgi:hypothetical protein
VKTREPGHVVNAKDKTGLVTKVAARRIDIITENGHNTWRAPQNLRVLSQYE